MDATEIGRPMDLLALCETLKANAEDVAVAIIDHWQAIGQSEPWHAIPDDLDYNHLPKLIRELAGAALCTEFDPMLCRQVVQSSALHGQHRGEEGLDDTLLYREYHLLRRALWRQLKEDHGETTTVYYATMRVDALISLANAAALYGLYRPRLEAERRWPDVLEELLESWPLPGS